MIGIDLECREKLKKAEEEIERLKAEVARLQAALARRDELLVLIDKNPSVDYDGFRPHLPSDSKPDFGRHG